MRKVYVLDTGAVFHLHNKHSPRLLHELRMASIDSTIYIPAVVLVEANQAKQLYKKRIETIFEIADVADLNEYFANKAAEGLRAVPRAKCEKCSGFVGPSLVDAIVMAFAHEYVCSGSEAILFTSDMDHMAVLRDAFFEGVTLRAC